MKTKQYVSRFAFLVWLSVVSAPLSSAYSQGASFTYQGKLNAGANAAAGFYDFTFTLFNASSGGSIIGGPVTNTAVPVTNGLFTTLVNLGAGAFNGGSNWLSIGVRTNGGGVFSPLTPLQQVAPTPYAIFAETANAAGLTGTIPASGLSSVNGAGLTNVNAAKLGGFGANAFWQTTGNAGTTAGPNFAGTTDNQPFYLDVHGSPVLQLATNNSIVMGNGTLSSSGGSYQVALGRSAIATGNGSVAIGYLPSSIGPGSVAIGESVTSSGNDSFASGGYTQATANDSTAMGYYSIASGIFSMALGYEAQALHNGSFVWADQSAGVYASTGPNQFLIRAAGGVGIGVTGSPQQYLSVRGGMNLDQAADNQGYINNGGSTGYGLTFGDDSGEGIASQRQAGGGGNNQFGLDFYTDFTARMSITHSGFVGIGTQTPINPTDTQLGLYSPTTNGYDGMWIQTGAGGTPFYGFSEGGGFTAWTEINGQNGNAWELYNGGFWLTVLPSGNVGVNTTAPSESLEINGASRIDDNDIYLRGAGDYNHGLGYRSAVNGSSITVDGPFLYGFNGGSLGCSGPDFAALTWNYQGNVWISNNCSVATLTVRGGADLAEPFNISAGKEQVAQGAVVVIDEENPGHLKISDSPYDTRVAGVVSGANGVNPGIQMHQQGLIQGGQNVALSGRVYVQADTSNGSIHPGDMLTTSGNRGRAMKVSDHARAAGAILGKAMTGLSQGQGMVLVLVTLQ